MSNIKNALTRKLGPLPAWAWFLIVGVALYWYRSHTAAATTTTGTGTVQPTPGTSPITTLDPGQSAYDPNTGALETAPGGSSSGNGGGGTGPDLTQPLEDLATAIGNMNNGSSGAGDGSGTGTGAGGSGTTSTTPPQQRMSKLTAAMAKAGDIALPFGSKKPTTNIPKGYKEVGKGNGLWVLAPIKAAARTVKTKPGGGNASKGKTTRTTTNKGRTRSVATLKINNPGRGRASTKVTKAFTARSRAKMPTAPKPAARQRPTHNVVAKPALQQHPVAPRAPARKPAPPPPPRPSAPKPAPRRVVKRK